VTSDAVAFVVDDPNALFEVQSAATSGVQQTVVGNNADSVYTSGSLKTGMSAVEISGTTAATSAQLRIVGVSSDPDNSTLGTGSASGNVNLIVKINEHFYAQTVGV
jgi:Flp pilus assembly CpaE family ATPase